MKKIEDSDLANNPYQSTFEDKKILNFTLGRDYDLVATLNLRTNIYTILSFPSNGKYEIPASGDFSAQFKIICGTIVHPDDREDFERSFHTNTLFESLQKTGDEKRCYCRILSADDSYRWKCVHFSCFEPEHTTIVFTVQDVHEAKNAKDRETMANHIFALAFQELYTHIYKVDLVSGITHEIYCTENGIHKKQVSVDKKSVLEGSYTDLLHPDYRDSYRRELAPASIRQKLKNGERIYYEAPRLSFDGCYRWHSIQIQFLSEDENSYKIMVYIQDVDARRREDEQKQQMLKDALMMAESANRAKSDFLSRMSHDIRTPMNAIIGMAAIANENLNAPEKIRDCLKKIDVSAHFLLSLINDILDMSKIESGKILITNSPFDFSKMIHGLKTVFAPQAAEKGVDFQIVTESGFPSGCNGDELRINQILMNLIGNAVKFTDCGGRVTLSIKRNMSKDGKTLVHFEVTDTGRGMSPDFQQIIFDPFEQEHSDTGRVMEGSGLGMAITKNLVQLMDGTIRLESAPGKGTTFEIDLPLELTEASPCSHTEEAGMDFTSLRVLVVDDDVVTCEHTRLLLEKLGIHPVWVTSGKKAIEEVREAKSTGRGYDAALIDWKMDEMDGLETAREIREITGFETPVIIMSSFDWSEIEKEARHSGVNFFLTKPLTSENIRTVLADAMEHLSRHTPDVPDYDFSRYHVLLVEDNEINMEISKTLLEMKGTIVETAYDGLQAVQMVEKSPDSYYDAVLMDIRMPVMDGITATRRIRRLPRKDVQTLPIIAMTANAFDEDKKYAGEMGMDGYLIKPIDTDLLYKELAGFFFRK